MTTQAKKKIDGELKVLITVSNSNRLETTEHNQTTKKHCHYNETTYKFLMVRDSVIISLAQKH